LREDDAKELSRFTTELQRETERGAAIVGASFIDTRLGETLAAFLCDGPTTEALVFGGNAPLGTFSARIDAAAALALIDEHEKHECHIIRKVRNEFAHRLHGISFKDDRISGLCNNLKCDYPSDTPITPRDLFINSVVTITSSLFYRPEHALQAKIKPKIWFDKEFFRWRKITDEPPSKDGQPIMLFGKSSTGRPVKP